MKRTTHPPQGGPVPYNASFCESKQIFAVKAAGLPDAVKTEFCDQSYSRSLSDAAKKSLPKNSRLHTISRVISYFHRKYQIHRTSRFPDLWIITSAAFSYLCRYNGV